MTRLRALLTVAAALFLASNALADDEGLTSTGENALYSSSFLQEEATEEAADDMSAETVNYFFFIDGYGGKERMVRDEFPDGHCAGIFGAKVGVTPQLTDHLELEAAFGGKIDPDDTEFSSVFGDIALNGVFARHSFVGAGVSFWDLTEDDTRTAALLVHFGIGLTENGKYSFVAEGRIPFDQFDDASNNYMFWGGIRIRFGGRPGEVVPPPPSPPAAPPTPPPAPPAPTPPPAEPEFVWPEVYFPFDQYILTAEAREKLDSVAKYLTDKPDASITIEGHCCYIGTDEYNQALGQQRADAIRDYLTGKGISATRLKTVSYGEAKPKYDNEKEITRRFNRRGFFVVIRPQ